MSSVTWNMSLLETVRVLKAIKPGLITQLSEIGISEIYGKYDFEEEQMLLNMSCRIDVSDEMKKELKNTLREYGVDS